MIAADAERDNAGRNDVSVECSDLVKHAHYEAVTRYQVATWIGLELAVALALTYALLSDHPRSRIWSTLAFVFILACGATSVLVNRPYALWWENNQTLDSEAVAAAIPGYLSPVIIVERPVAVDVLALGRYLYPYDRLLLVGSRKVVMQRRPELWYVFLPNSRLKAALAKQGRLTNVSPATRSAVPSLAQDSQRAADPKNALWKWEPIY